MSPAVRKTLLAFTLVLLGAALAAVAFWPEAPDPQPEPAAAAEDDPACDSCALRHQRLTKPSE